jgi:hypothetical protein
MGEMETDEQWVAPFGNPRNACPGDVPTLRREDGNPVGTGQARGAASPLGAAPGDRAACGSVRLHVFPRALREFGPAMGRHRPLWTALALAGVPVGRGHDIGKLITAGPGPHEATGRTARHGATRCETGVPFLAAGTSGGGV